MRLRRLLQSQDAKHLVPILGVFALTLLYFSDALTGRTLLVERDLASFFYPFRFIWVETVRQGHFPFWNPYIKCGVPLFATIQPGVLYPSSFLYLFLPLDLAFNWTIIFHFFLAGGFTYLLMREFEATLQGSMAAAIAFVFGGYLISTHNVLNTLLSVSWYPLAVLCGCRMFKGGQLRWAVACGLSLCFMFLGGGFEIVIFALATLFLLCLHPRILPAVGGERPPTLWRRLGLLGFALVIYLGLSMVQLLPFLELYPHSARYEGVPLEEATRWSLAPRDLFYFLIPDLHGSRTTADLYWKFQNYLKTIYVGPICFFLAGYYFLRQGRRSIPLLTAMGLVIIVALGRYTPIYPFLYKHFPFFDTLRYPAKFLFLFIFFLCVSVGLGLDVIRHRFSEKRDPGVWYQRFLVAGVVALTGLLILARLFPERIMGVVYQLLSDSLNPAYLSMALHNLTRLLVVSILGLLVIFFGLRGKLPKLGGLLLLTLLALDLFLGNRGFAQKLDAVNFHAETPMIRALKQDSDLFRFHVTEDRQQSTLNWTDYRYFHLRRKEALGYDLMMEHHLFDIDGYNVPLQPRYERFIGLVRNMPFKPPVPVLLDMINVKYVLTEGPVDLPGYVWVRDGPEKSKLYENQNFLPRAFLVSNYRVLESDQEFAKVFHDLAFDPQRTLFLEKVPQRFQALKTESSAPSVRSEVKVLAYENNRILLDVSTPEAAFLFMSEAYYPGWKAYVDGRKEEILQANYVFRAIPVGPGFHRVEVVMQPLSFKVGLAVSLLTIVVLMAGWVISATKKRSRFMNH